eukprot:SAG31_NODE_24143_length_488_cov_0.925450_1_plen_39_part_10
MREQPCRRTAAAALPDDAVCWLMPGRPGGGAARGRDVQR